MRQDDRWLVAGIWACTALMVCTVLFNALFGGVFYDTDHFSDSLFILGAAWRSHEGLTPAVDFGYFYGGVLEDGLALTMRLLGHGVFVFDYFTLLLALGLAVAVRLILGRSLSRAGLAAVILLVTLLMLTRHPLEYDHAVSTVVSTHSFLYNRFGLAVVVIAGLHVALPSPGRNAEILGGVGVGLLVGLTALVKPTFAILAPAVIAGLMLQRRWGALGGALAGMAGAILSLDPQLARWRGALAYSMAQIGEDRAARLDYVAMKALRGLLVQPLATFLTAIAIGSLLVRRVSVPAALGLLLVALAGVGMTATMGGHIGQVILPITLMIALAAAEIAGQRGLEQRGPLRILAFCMVAALALPHAANLLAAAVEGNRKQGELLLTEGPYARYLSMPFRAEDPMPTSQYQMFADGVAELAAMGDASQWGIIADQGISFEYALLARPVPGYPLWQRPTAPELAADRPLGPEVDVVLLGRSSPAVSLRDVLMAKMGDDFLPCRTSRHWEIHVRRGRNIPGCG